MLLKATLKGVENKLCAKRRAKEMPGLDVAADAVVYSCFYHIFKFFFCVDLATTG